MLDATTVARRAALPDAVQRTAPAERLDRLSAKSRRTLVLANSFALPYRVLRCAAEMSDVVYVMGSREAAGLARSRSCDRFFPTNEAIDGRYNPRLAAAINEISSAHHIKLVVGADAEAARSLIAVRELLGTPSFPMPDLPAFDLLNDKWRFKQLCDRLGIPHPATVICPQWGDLPDAVRAGGLRYPIIAKPTNLSGGLGCLRLNSESDAKEQPSFSYSPIIVQEFIEGPNIAACLYCERGRILSFFAQSYQEGVYKIFLDDQLRSFADRIVSTLHLDGILNFDIVCRPNGDPAFLECTPRVYFKIMMSMLAGVNLLAAGAPWRGGRECPSDITPAEVVMPRGFALRLLTPWKLNPGAGAALRYLLTDPVPLVLERTGLER